MPDPGDNPRASDILDAVAALCREPDRLVDAFAHTPPPRFTIEPHTHRDLLQLDLIEGCEGRCCVDGRWRPMAGLTAMTSYPGEEHGYNLRRLPGEPRVYHLKCRVSARWPLVQNRTLRSYVTRLDGTRDVLGPMRLLTRSSAEISVDPAQKVAWLAELFALWPRAGQVSGLAPRDRSAANLEAMEPRLAAAFHLLHTRHDPPPSLDELAAAAHLSSRHFARRFRELVGCSPHAYATARRLGSARDLLRDPSLRIVDVAEQLGFSSSPTFSRWFSQQAGVSPSQFRSDPASF